MSLLDDGRIYFLTFINEVQGRTEHIFRTVSTLSKRKYHEKPLKRFKKVLRLPSDTSLKRGVNEKKKTCLNSYPSSYYISRDAASLISHQETFFRYVEEG